MRFTNTMLAGPRTRAGLNLWMLAAFLGAVTVAAAAAPGVDGAPFPPPLESYRDAHLTGVWEVLQHRVRQEPFNLVATLLFLGAVVHTFFTHKFRHWAHVLEERKKARQAAVQIEAPQQAPAPPTSLLGRVLHFLGEVEAVFGIWVVPLLAGMVAKVGWTRASNYLNRDVSYEEVLFVVVIMAISSTRPILQLAEQAMSCIARLGGGRPVAWWLSILTVGPVLGSLITEPAAMTITASLLAKQFYAFKPRPRFAYATLGLLFVNVSVGGVLTHFAAPPVLMVARPWQWTTPFMFQHFGWVALVGIAIANALYLLAFRKEFSAWTPAPGLLTQPRTGDAIGPRIPAWVTLGHLLFMAWSVLNAHHSALLIGGFLFFLAFYEVTQDCQAELQLRSPILVGFFLAGLVIHGGLQQWWIAPVLSRLSELPLMLGAIGLTAFNDNAAITYLATLVPGTTEAMKYAVVAGAVTGGGLTVIANAPNPAGQAILGRHFPDGIAPLGLFLGALPATIILALCFLLFG
jgi:hypothetical protein